jgi:hypothetical protein
VLIALLGDADPAMEACHRLDTADQGDEQEERIGVQVHLSLLHVVL